MKKKSNFSPICIYLLNLCLMKNCFYILDKHGSIDNRIDAIMKMSVINTLKLPLII